MDKKIYKKTEEQLERELDDIARKQNISMDDLVLMDKILDNLKDISIICAMGEESEYSERMMYDADASYARKRDSMGRYASRGSYDNGSYRGSYGDSYRSSYENGYSGHEDLDRMLREAKSDREKDLIKQLKEIKER